MKTKVIVTLLISYFIIGCSTIPPEASELSTELGKKISSIEKANINLLHRFFDQKREKVDRFIEDEWIPTFAENIFSQTKVSKMWEMVVKEGNKEDRLKFLIMVGPELQKEINKKRLELISPLDTLERTLESYIRTEYTQAKSINNSITSLLFSSSKVTENRNRYLRMLDIGDNKIEQVINKTDEIVENLLNKSEDAPEKVEKAKAFTKKIKSLRDSI